MEGYRFSLRDIPQREILNNYAKQFPALNIQAVESCIALLRTASNISKVFDEYFASFGISEGKFVILMLLYRQDDYKLSPMSLSTMAEVTKATMTGLIGGLEAQGFIDKIPNSNDQRGYLVHLSQKGLDLLENILPAHYMLNSKVMSALEDGQLRELSHLLNLLSNNLTNINKSKEK